MNYFQRQPRKLLPELDQTFIDALDVVVGGGGSLETQARLVDKLIGLDNANTLNTMLSASGLQQPLFKTLSQVSQEFVRSKEGQQLIDLSSQLSLKNRF